MTDPRALVAEAEALAAAATPGPWVADHRLGGVLGGGRQIARFYWSTTNDEQARADTDLAARSRMLCPELAAALKEALDVLEELEDCADGGCPGCGSNIERGDAHAAACKLGCALGRPECK